MANENIDKDELRKSLTELEFSDAEIKDILQKAEKDEKDDETVDEIAAKDAEGKETKVSETDDMKKAYEDILNKKKDIDKSMTDFLNKYGNAPGIKTPDTDLEKVKAENYELNKSEVNGFEKAFGSKFESIEKGFSEQSKINEEIMKSLQGITTTVQAIADAPNPLKSLLGNYNRNILEKGEKTNKDGKRVLSYTQNKEAVLDEFAKAVDKVENEDDKQKIRNMISTLSISNRVSAEGIDIVNKALDIDIIK